MDVCEAPVFLTADSRGWAQLNVGLACASGSLRAAAGPLFDELERWLAAARERGAIEHWFVRKAPALRLRLRGPGFDARAREQLARLLDAHRERSLVSRWGWATYEPEVDRLGGPHALALVHTLLSESTDVWLAWERLSRAGQTQLGPDLMALSLYGDLLSRSLGATEEVWDVWLTLLRIYDPNPSIPARGSDGPRLLAPSGLTRLASASEQALLERGRAAAERFAQELTRAHDECTLQGGRRALLGTLASFLFNLWCLHPATVAELCRVAVRELHPGFEVAR